MPIVQRFAQVFGAVYVLVGVAGFMPPLLIGSVPGVLEPFAGLLLALFAVNWFHSLAHLLIGAVGVAVYRSYSVLNPTRWRWAWPTQRSLCSGCSQPTSRP